MYLFEQYVRIKCLHSKAYARYFRASIRKINKQDNLKKKFFYQIYSNSIRCRQQTILPLQNGMVLHALKTAISIISDDLRNI